MQVASFRCNLDENICKLNWTSGVVFTFLDFYFVLFAWKANELSATCRQFATPTDHTQHAACGPFNLVRESRLNVGPMDITWKFVQCMQIIWWVVCWKNSSGFAETSVVNGGYGTSWKRAGVGGILCDIIWTLDGRKDIMSDTILCGVASLPSGQMDLHKCKFKCCFSFPLVLYFF